MHHISSESGAGTVPSTLAKVKKRDGGFRNTWVSWSRVGRQRKPRSREEEIKREVGFS